MWVNTSSFPYESFLHRRVASGKDRKDIKEITYSWEKIRISRSINDDLELENSTSLCFVVEQYITLCLW